MRRLLSVLAVLAAAACSSTSLPPVDGDPRLEFAAAADARDYLFPTPRATAERLADGISVSTMMTHPVGCREFGAELNGTRELLVVDVAITPIPTFVACPERPTNYAYTARLRDLAPGDYHLVVRHVYPNGDRPDVVVLDTEITIA